MPKLTEKQKRFCEEYLIDLNAAQAAIRAGYSAKGINKRTTRMMANEGIQQYLAELRNEQSARTRITADTVLGELVKIASADVEVTERGKMKALELLGKHLGLFTSGADNSDTLAKLDEVLGRIEGEI